MDNPNNILINKVDVEKILNKLGDIGGEPNCIIRIPLKINNIDPYRLAFVHPSYHQNIESIVSDPTIKIHLDYRPEKSYQVLEFVGDKFGNASTALYIKQRFPNLEEGDLTKLLTRLVRSNSFSNFADRLGFKKFLLLSNQVDNLTFIGESRGRNTERFLEDIFESFIYAIIEDFGEMGYIYVKRFIFNILDKYPDYSSLLNNNENFKDSLQRKFQSDKWKNPVYITVYENGLSHNKVFCRALFISLDQFNFIDSELQLKLSKYQKDKMEYLLTSYPDCYKNVINLLNADNTKLFSIGLGKKVIFADQDCAKSGLINLNLPLDY
jgi:ribonuclease-3